MMDLAARTEVHDAWTNIALAEALMKAGKWNQAMDALFDAESHYRTAERLVELPASMKVKLEELNKRIGTVRSRLDVAQFAVTPINSRPTRPRTLPSRFW
jgi:hypothetical protein